MEPGDDDQQAVRVLHAEDDDSFRELVTELFEAAAGIDSAPASSPTEALSLLASERFDCVVSDYDGEERASFRPLIEATEGGPPCILLTGKERDRIDPAASAAVDDYVRKGSSDQFAQLTERVRNHAERHRSAERYRALFEEGAGPMAVHDVETGRLVDVNPQYAALLGYDRAEAASLTMADLLPDDSEYDTEGAIERLRRAADGEAQTSECVNETAEGEAVPVEVTLKRMDVAGAGRVLATVRDISDRKRREAALARHERNLARLHEAAQRLLGAESYDAVYDRVRDAAESTLDPAFCAVVAEDDGTFYPVAAGGHAGDEPPDPFPVEGSSEGEALRERETQVGESEYGRMLCVPLDGHGVLCVRGFAPAPENARELAEVLASHASVALDRAEKEARLRASVRRRRSLATAFPDYVFFLDADNVYREVWTANDHAERGGYNEDELRNHPVSEVLSAETAARIGDAVDAALSTGEVQEVEYEAEERDRTSVYEGRVAPLPGVEGDPEEVVLVARDVTTQREHEATLERQNERLDEFASLVSHDLRNPLNVVQGRVGLVEQATDDEGVLEHAGAAAEAADRMDALIDDMLTVARTDEQELRPKPVSLGRAAERAWSAVSEPAASLDVRVGDTVSADEGELIRLLENLFRNSVEHVGVDVSVRLEPLDGGGSGSLGFAVVDDGPGIDEQHREQVFESGYSTASDGTGYGLDIVERVADAHGWTVSLVGSTAGDGDEGARFEVTGVEFVDG